MAPKETPYDVGHLDVMVLRTYDMTVQPAKTLCQPWLGMAAASDNGAFSKVSICMSSVFTRRMITRSTNSKEFPLKDIWPFFPTMAIVFAEILFPSPPTTSYPFWFTCEAI